MKSPTVLIADDDSFVRSTFTEVLKPLSLNVIQASSASETWKAVVTDHPALVLLDLRFPDCDDLRLLHRIKEEQPFTEVIVISASSAVSEIVQSVQRGAYDYLTKPVVPDELRHRVSRALELIETRNSCDTLLQEMRSKNGLETLRGNSAPIRLVRQSIQRLASSDCTVLIEGESGTGKELAARALHYQSPRHRRPLITVNAASVPVDLAESSFFGHRKGSFTGAIDSSKGFFERAEDGTLFLDEIGEMPLEQQAALLRVLEYRRFTPVGEAGERECRARFVFATNRNLKQEVERGRFRQDLFYRIRVATIHMPSLREIREDIAHLAEVFCAQHACSMSRPPVAVDPLALEALMKHSWKGNARELRNALETALILLPPERASIGLHDLPSYIREEADAGPANAQGLSVLEQQEAQEIARVLKQCGGNQTQAARLLGLHRNTLRYKVRQFGITL